MQVFRIDDISINTPRDQVRGAIDAIAKYAKPQDGAEILFAVSPLVHDMSNEPEADRGRVFPRILSAMSDHRNFFRVNRCGLPDWLEEEMFFAKFRGLGARLASHGLIHVDHRLLSIDVQELSIVASCALSGTKVFVPPFNKWNRSTELVCTEHKIDLVKFEDGWRHVKFNKYSIEHERYYFHTHDTSVEFLERWLAA